MPKFSMLRIITLLTIINALSACSYDHESYELPLNSETHIPQGFTKTPNGVLLSVHDKDKASYIYKIDIDKKKSHILFKMPKYATHTSGLCFNNGNLIATDYNSKKIYDIDLQESIKAKEAVINYSFNSGLKGLSACDFIKRNNKNILIVSDFRNTKETFLIDYDKLNETGLFEKSILRRYKNNGFSQGVLVSNGKIYESGNSWFAISKIDILDFDALYIDGTIVKETHFLPVFGVQDLIETDGIYFFDEVDFKLHKLIF